MYNPVGIPNSLLVPLALSRIRHPYYVILFASVCLLVRYVGLAFYPTFDWAGSSRRAWA